MSLKVLQEAIDNKKMVCPKCKNPVQQFEKFVELTESVWDGAGDSGLSTKGSKVTLICGNSGCEWKERTEYWDNYIS